MRKNGWKISLIAFGVMAFLAATSLAMAEDQAAAPAKPADHAYVGSKTCKTCHMGEKNGKIWETWLESKHAKSLSVLDSAKGERSDPKCLKCHTVGFGAETGFKAGGDMAPEGLAAVGCESCHGAGADYKSMKVMKDKAAAVAAGLVIPTEETCKKCHNAESPTFKGFDFKAMYAKIEHHIPKAAAPAEGTGK
jgi:cytochrome c2